MGRMPAVTSRAVKPSDSSLTGAVVQEVGKRIVGQEAMLERLLIGLLTGGHILLEGVPRFAKTLAISSLAGTVRMVVHRLPSTPLPVPPAPAGAGLGARMLWQVHDELVLGVPEAELGDTAALVARVMEGAAHLDIPLVVDTGHARSWAEAH